MPTPDPHKEDARTGEGPGQPDGTSAVEEAVIVAQPADEQPAELHSPGLGSGNDAGNSASAASRWRDRLVRWSDKFALVAVKAVLFGLIAAVAGIVAAIVLRNYAELDQGLEFAAELALRDQEIASLKNDLPTLAEQIATRAGPEQISALADDLDRDRIQAGESLAQLKSELDLLDRELRDQLENLRAGIAQVEQAAPLTEAGDGAAAVDAVDLFSRLDALAGRIAELESRPANPATEPMAGAAIAVLEQRLAGLESSMTGPLAQPELAPRLEAAEQRLAMLEAGQTGDSFSARSLALIAIRAAVGTGAPYLSMIRDAGFADAEIPEVVMIHANTGVATLDELQRSFGPYARDTLRTESALAEDGGLSGILGSLVQLRPLAPRAGDDPASILSRAENLVKTNDLRGALETVALLSDAGQETMADWIEAGEARLAVLAAINTMLKDPEMSP